MTPLTPEQTHAYLHHIGIDDPGPPSLASLDRLIDAHLRRVAFENLDVLLDRPIEIDADKVFAKVVEGSRGGYCFELNSLFARLLLALGYELELLVARVRWGLPEDAPLTQQSHLMLRLYLAEGEFLVDVGFGSANPPRALPLPGDEADAGQVHCVRLVDPHAGLYESAVRGRSGWLPLYRFDLRPQLWIDYIPRNWYTSTHPHSVFRRHNRGQPAPDPGRRAVRPARRQRRDAAAPTARRRGTAGHPADPFSPAPRPGLRSAGAGATAGGTDLRLSAFGRCLFAGLLREFSDVP